MLVRSPAIASRTHTDTGVDVLCVPSGHPYVRHCATLRPGPPPVRTRPDPDPDDPRRDAVDRWWPPVALDPAWLATQDFDVLHVHFGYDDRTPEQLRALVAVLEDLRRPLVLTLHDLRNPHHADAELLDRQLDVLVPAAAALATLTDTAADRVERRWGRRPVVLPHPHVVPLAGIDAIRRARRSARVPDHRVVGLAVKSLRGNTDPVRLLPALRRVVRRHPDARLRLTAHHALRDRTDDRAGAAVAALDATVAEADPQVEVVWHDPWSDAELWAELAGQHVAVLPYLFGTHSGWLEACHDVGTPVLAPSVGCYAAQGADATYDADENALDEASLESGLEGLLARPAGLLAGVGADERAGQRQQVADRLEELYGRVVLAARGAAA